MDVTDEMVDAAITASSETARKFSEQLFTSAHYGLNSKSHMRSALESAFALAVAPEPSPAFGAALDAYDKTSQDYWLIQAAMSALDTLGFDQTDIALKAAYRTIAARKTLELMYAQARMEGRREALEHIREWAAPSADISGHMGMKPESFFVRSGDLFEEIDALMKGEQAK